MTKFYDFKYDGDIKKFQYLPYLSGINEEYITLFNKTLLKLKFGYHKDEKHPKNYNSKEGRYINDDDITKMYVKEYEDINILYERITNEFDKAIDNYNKTIKESEDLFNYHRNIKVSKQTLPDNMPNYSSDELSSIKKNIFETKVIQQVYSEYKRKVQTNLYNHSKYLKDIIEKTKKINNEGSIVDKPKTKFLNIKNLIVIIVIVIILILLLIYFI